MEIFESTAQEKWLLRKVKISQVWFRCFIEHQPQLSLRKGDHTAFVVCMDLINYFITLKSVLEDNNLLDKPECTYNVDESGVPLEHLDTWHGLKLIIQQSIAKN